MLWQRGLDARLLKVSKLYFFCELESGAAKNFYVEEKDEARAAKIGTCSQEGGNHLEAGIMSSLKDFECFSTVFVPRTITPHANVIWVLSSSVPAACHGFLALELTG